VKFIEFRLEMGLEMIWPVPEAHILLFISFLSIQQFSPSTINSHIAALSFVHNVNGWVNPTESFMVSKLKEGCRRSNRRSDGRLPITPSLLSRIINVLPLICKSSYEAQLFKAAFLLAFFGFLRVGELASTKHQDISRLIALNDISFASHTVTLRIRYSKTDQLGNAFYINIQGSSNMELCPVKALLSYLNFRPPHAGPLFIHFNKEAITSAQFSFILKEGIKLLGLCPRFFSSHSFRIGAATAAAICGFNEESIKCFGRWKSSAYRSYIRPSTMASSL